MFGLGVNEEDEVSEESGLAKKFGGGSLWWGAGCEKLDFGFLGKVQDIPHGGKTDFELFCCCCCSVFNWPRVVMVGWLIFSSSGMVGRCKTLLISSKSCLNLTALGWSVAFTLEMFSKRMV